MKWSQVGGKNNHDYIHVLSCQQIKLINKKKTSKCGELVGKKSFDKGKEKVREQWGRGMVKMTSTLHTCMKTSKENDFKSLLKHLGKTDKSLIFPWCNASSKATGMLYLRVNAELALTQQDEIWVTIFVFTCHPSFKTSTFEFLPKEHKNCSRHQEYFIASNEFQNILLVST